MEHLEGRQSVLAALRARSRKFQVILVAQGAHIKDFSELEQAAADLAVPIKLVDRDELDKFAHGASHGGILAICTPKPRTTPTELLKILDDSPNPPLLLLIEGIEDARNLGFVLRTAEAQGATAVMIKKHLWDLDSVEIARPASGAYERLPLVQVEGVDLLMELRKRGLQLIGCIAGARSLIYQADLFKPVILCIGGEKRGLSGAVREICDQFVTIPAVAGTSLSLSHAAAIVMAEANRQRHSGKPEIKNFVQ
jgi:23S rRNA (guanosine2251-2'-O)-methyltransferase